MLNIVNVILPIKCGTAVHPYPGAWRKRKCTTASAVATATVETLATAGDKKWLSNGHASAPKIAMNLTSSERDPGYYPGCLIGQMPWRGPLLGKGNGAKGELILAWRPRTAVCHAMCRDLWFYQSVRCNWTVTCYPARAQSPPTTALSLSGRTPL